jgi:hypothetical protein
MFGLRLVPAAEVYLFIGRTVRYALRRGDSLQCIARDAGLPIAECLLAVTYADSPDWLKFRAIVEEWPWNTIKQALAASRNSYRP